VATRPSTDAPSGVRRPVFRVLVDDNYHYMHQDERYQAAEFGDYASAVEKCEAIVEDCLQEQLQYRPGMSAESLLIAFKMFGEDPWVSPTPEGVESFSAWDYAEQRCQEVAERRPRAKQAAARKGGKLSR
jgi:hypothetical protein